ncbi:MAG: RidA family protein [Sneathiellaceae bacterium]
MHKQLRASACAALLSIPLVLGAVASKADSDGHQIATDPDPYAQFLISQAIRVDNLVFLSGQAAIDAQGNLVGVGDFDAQAKQTFENLKKVLEASGSSMDRIVKVTIYLTDMANFPKIMELRKAYFSKPYPADTIVEISALGLPELQIEIDAVGLVGGKLHEAK